MHPAAQKPLRILGRYALYAEIAAGGMATVHLGRLLGTGGFSRTVAIKRLHAQFAKDPEFVAMFLAEARLAARIRHPNVIPTLDVVSTDGEVFLVMEFVVGESLSRLLNTGRHTRKRVPYKIAVSIISGVLHGLHAAHEAKDEKGGPLGIVHRDVSPQNILVGSDGIAHIFDFGVAKSAMQVQSTREGQLKGKLAYMAPEQIEGKATRQSDVYATAIVLWELLIGQRLFTGESEAEILNKVLFEKMAPPSTLVPEIPFALDEVVLKGLARELDHRYLTARDFAAALESAVGIASPSQIGQWIEENASEAFSKRANQMAEFESMTSGDFSIPAGTMISNALSGNSDHGHAPIYSDPHTLVAPVSDLAAASISESSLSKSRGGFFATREAKARILFYLVIALIFGSLLTTVVLLRRKQIPPDEGVIIGSPAESTTPAIDAATSTGVPASINPLHPALPSDDTIIPTASDSPPLPSKPKPNAPHSRVTLAPVTKPSASVQVDLTCEPPFTLDSEGHKHYKVKCLR